MRAAFGLWNIGQVQLYFLVQPSLLAGQFNDAAFYSQVDQESGETPAGSRQELLHLTALSPRVPIFMSHGIYDEIISPGVSRLSRDRLRSANHTVFYQTYPVGHSPDKDVATDFSRWCARLLDYGTLDKSSFTS